MKFLCTCFFFFLSNMQHHKKNHPPKKFKKVQTPPPGRWKKYNCKTGVSYAWKWSHFSPIYDLFSPAIYCNLAWLSTIINRVHFLVSHYANSSSIFAKILRGGRWHVQGWICTLFPAMLDCTKINYKLLREYFNRNFCLQPRIWEEGWQTAPH